MQVVKLIAGIIGLWLLASLVSCFPYGFFVWGWTVATTGANNDMGIDMIPQGEGYRFQPDTAPLYENMGAVISWSWWFPLALGALIVVGLMKKPLWGLIVKTLRRRRTRLAEAAG